MKSEIWAVKNWKWGKPKVACAWKWQNPISKITVDGADIHTHTRSFAHLFLISKLMFWKYIHVCDFLFYALFFENFNRVCSFISHQSKNYVSSTHSIIRLDMRKYFRIMINLWLLYGVIIKMLYCLVP